MNETVFLHILNCLTELLCIPVHGLDLLPAGLPWSGKLPVLFLLSSQKSTFYPLAEKLWTRSKNESHLFWWARRALSPCKVWGKIAQRAPAVDAKMWCLFFSFCHAPSPEHRAFEGCIVRTSIALPFIARFRRGFQRFSRMDSSFRRAT